MNLYESMWIYMNLYESIWCIYMFPKDSCTGESKLHPKAMLSLRTRHRSATFPNETLHSLGVFRQDLRPGTGLIAGTLTIWLFNIAIENHHF